MFGCLHGLNTLMPLGVDHLEGGFMDLVWQGACKNGWEGVLWKGLGDRSTITFDAVRR